jgi:general secretion pathway protein G
MAEQGGSDLRDINVQHKRSAGKIKLSSRELWSLIWPILLGAFGIYLIIGSVMIMISPPRRDSSKWRIANIQIAEFENALQLYAEDNGSFPTTVQGLDALVHNLENSDSWKGPYLGKDLPLDPWAKPYVYRRPGLHGDYDIYSAGPDNIEGNGDDICSWKDEF